jgi:glycosyltransferase
MTSKVAVNHGSFDLRFKIAADFDFMKKVILDPVFNGVYLNRYIVKMRLGGLSTSNNLISQNLEVFKSLKNSFPKYSLWLFVILKLKNKLPQKLF